MVAVTTLAIVAVVIGLPVTAVILAIALLCAGGEDGQGS